MSGSPVVWNRREDNFAVDACPPLNLDHSLVDQLKLTNELALAMDRDHVGRSLSGRLYPTALPRHLRSVSVK